MVAPTDVAVPVDDDDDELQVVGVKLESRTADEQLDAAIERHQRNTGQQQLAAMASMVEQMRQ
eukprot:13396122-Alexandrium_andersonii.AAC.1